MFIGMKFSSVVKGIQLHISPAEESWNEWTRIRLIQCQAGNIKLKWVGMSSESALMGDRGEYVHLVEGGMMHMDRGLSLQQKVCGCIETGGE